MKRWICPLFLAMTGFGTMVTGEPVWAQEAEQDDAGQAESVLTPAE